jgi:hypothetical protein
MNGEYREAFNATVDLMHKRPFLIDMILETLLENSKKRPDDPRAKGVIDCIRQYDRLKGIPQLLT